MIHGERFVENSAVWKQRVMRYRERWSIENGFRDVKQHFWLDRRSRKPTRRFSRVVMGMRFYNKWHLCRLRRMVEKKRKKNPRYIPFDPKIRHLRRRLEREYGRLLSAEGYLLSLVRDLFKFELKKVLGPY